MCGQGCGVYSRRDAPSGVGVSFGVVWLDFVASDKLLGVRPLPARKGNAARHTAFKMHGVREGTGGGRP